MDNDTEGDAVTVLELALMLWVFDVDRFPADRSKEGGSTVFLTHTDAHNQSLVSISELAMN